MSHPARGIRLSLIPLALVITFCGFFPAPATANSVIEDARTTWTAVGEFNLGSGGWDLRVLLGGQEVRSFWITADAASDEDPFILLNPRTGQPVVFWSRQAAGESRIYCSAFNGHDFGSPTAITSGGEGFSDLQPFAAFGEDGRCHLVWVRRLADGSAKAFYLWGDELGWTSPVQFSLPFDAVLGTVTIRAEAGAPWLLEASYQYRGASGQIGERHCCQGGDTSPWSACPH